jgi:YD repeat-containing protein
MERRNLRQRPDSNETARRPRPAVRRQSGGLNLRHNSFDAKGNLISKSDATGPIDYAYDALDQLTAESGPSVNSYQYDANGNRLEKSEEGYTYALASNRLTGKGGQAVITALSVSTSSSGTCRVSLTNPSFFISRLSA